MRLCRVLALLALLACPALSAEAGGAILSANISPLVRRPRSRAPMWVSVTFQSPQSRLIEGQLEITLWEGQELLGQYRSGPLAITTGRQGFRFLMPPCTPTTQPSAVQAELRFQTEKEVISLGRQALSVPALDRRQFVVVVCTTRTRGKPAELRLAEDLRLEEHDPSDLPRAQLSYTTSLARVAPDDLPAMPLGYCAFDVVVLTAPAFARLRAAPLEALFQWVAAGGSLCVFRRGDLSERQRAFLQALAGDGESGPVPGDDRIRMVRCGLGRAVVVPSPGGVLPRRSSPQWRRAMAFLWKMRGSQTAAMVGKGQWRRDQESPDDVLQRAATFQPLPAGVRSQLFSMFCQPVPGWACLPEALLPEDIRPVPPGLLALLFLAFIAIVGPVDYWLLGLLRRRRWTWLLFPAVSVGFAASVMWLSAEYMMSEQGDRALVFVDKGPAGRTLRRSRYELTFAPREISRWVEVQNALYSERLLGQSRGQAAFAVSVGVMGDAVERPPAYEGRFPGHYAALRRMEQWRPKLSRFSFLSPSDEPPGLNWDAVRPEDLRTRRGRAMAAARLTEGRDFDGCIYYCSALGFHYVAGDRGVFRTGTPAGARLRDLVRDCCVRPPVGLFSVVSQVAPHGGCDFEDLALIDGTASGAAVLLAARRDGADYVIYRRLYGGEH